MENKKTTTLLLSFIPLLFFIIISILEGFEWLIFSPISWVIRLLMAGCFIYQVKCFLYDSKVPMVVKKVVNILSFVPIILIIISSFNSFGEGFSIFFGMVYGTDAFEYSMIVMIGLLIIIPILPMCLIYQIMFLIYKRKERKNI